MDEKVLRLPRTGRKFNTVGFCLAAVRLFQWSSAFFAYASFSLLNLQENERMRAVEILGLISLIYTTIIICGVHICKTLGLPSWRMVTMCSLGGDLTIMGLFIAKITILSSGGLPVDCHGLRRDTFDDSDLIRQQAVAWPASMAAERDTWCAFPRTVYGLSVAAIYTYTLTLILSVLYLQQPKQQVIDMEKLGPPPNSPRPTLRYMGMNLASSTHAPSILDLDIESFPSSPVLSAHNPGPSRYPSPHHSTSTRTSRTHSVTSSWGGITLATCSSDTDSVRSGGSQPLQPVPGSSAPQGRRWSTSTGSSFDANAFIVTDGFRPSAGEEEDRPPAYESRPGSLYNETVKYPAGLGLPGTPKP